MATYNGTDGDDILTAFFTENSTINAGAGNDYVHSNGGPGTVSTITLGAGQDIAIAELQMGGTFAGGTVVFTDFQAGAGGDRFHFLIYFYQGWYTPLSGLGPAGLPSPFASGNAQLIDSAGGALLQLRSNTSDAWHTVATFQGLTADQFHADNFFGWDPDGTAAPGATISTPFAVYPSFIYGTESYFVDTYGNDTINGTDGRDLIDFSEGQDVIYAGGGNDEVFGFAGVASGYKTVYLGAGDDELGFNGLSFGGPGMYGQPTGSTTWGIAYGGDGNDRMGGEWQAVTLYGEAGNDRLTGSGSSGDYLDGGADDDYLTGGVGDDTLFGGTGNDTILLGSENDFADGGDGNDTFLSNGAGTDTMLGGAGNDVLHFGRTFFGTDLSADDVANGGDGADALVLQGNYTYTFSATNFTNIEAISVQTGSNNRWQDFANNRYDYNLTTVDANVAAGVQMIVNGQSLLAGEDFTFNGAAETDGRFLLYGGHGVEALTGGGQSDVFFFEGTRWGAGDVVHGGASNDALVFACGNGLNTFVFTDISFTSIESISVNNRFATDPSQTPSYSLTLANGNVAAGANLIVNGNSLAAGQTLTVDGHLELDGTLSLFGGAANDELRGGAGNDLLLGGNGADFLTGGGGNDTFRYDSPAHSAVATPDTILDFTIGDLIDLSRIDASSLTGDDQAFAFIGTAAFSTTAGELRFQAHSGTAWLVQGDTDGNGVADFQLLVNVADADPITAVDFVL